jgi:hypothetical protein
LPSTSPPLGRPAVKVIEDEGASRLDLAALQSALGSFKLAPG